jgi:hypothetical protein
MVKASHGAQRHLGAALSGTLIGVVPPPTRAEPEPYEAPRAGGDTSAPPAIACVECHLVWLARCDAADRDEVPASHHSTNNLRGGQQCRNVGSHDSLLRNSRVALLLL